MVRAVRTIYCLFSGGRDSAVACFIAKRVADVRGWGFRLVHVNTGVRLPGVGEYVRTYAEWLGAELVELHAKIDYWDGVMRWGYPTLWRNRWCIEWLKQSPLFEYFMRVYKPMDLVVMGIRQGESLFRLSEFTRVFYRHCHKKYGVCMNYWLPVLHAGDSVINALIRRYGIPTSPVWQRVGISGECMCMAGTTKSTLIKIARNYPEFVKWMAERDAEVQKKRYSKKPTYPAPLYYDKITLHEFVNTVLRNTYIDEYVANETQYVGKPCQGTCILSDSTTTNLGRS